MKILTILALTLFCAFGAFAQGGWQKMTEAELRKAVPDKAPVIKENIETEFRTASGVTNGTSRIFGVVIITAGYEADGKYTHFLRTQTRLKIGELTLEPGDYIFGYQRLDAESLRIMFYHAKDGELLGAAKAKVEKAKGPIYSFLITPPVAGQGKIFIGRFTFDYSLG